MPKPLPAVTGDEPNCPECKTSWIGDPIPEKDRAVFGKSTHFRRVIAIISRERDRCTHYKCPDCGVEFDRAP